MQRSNGKGAEQSPSRSVRILWGDQALEDAVRWLAPWLMPTYLSYPTMVQRTDAARLVLLLAYGGVYADLDVCVISDHEGGVHRATWVEVLDGSHGLVLPATEPMGVSNDLMAAAPGHPLLWAAVRALPRHALPVSSWLYLEYLRVLATTGPLLVSEQLLAMRGAEAIAAAGSPLNRATANRQASCGSQFPPVNSTGVRILTKAEYASRDALGGHSLVRHVRGSSWHNEGGDLLWRGWIRMQRLGVPTSAAIAVLVALYIVVVLILPLVPVVAAVAWLCRWRPGGLLLGWWLQLFSCGLAAALVRPRARVLPLQRAPDRGAPLQALQHAPGFLLSMCCWPTSSICCSHECWHRASLVLGCQSEGVSSIADCVSRG